MKIKYVRKVHSITEIENWCKENNWELEIDEMLLVLLRMTPEIYFDRTKTEYKPKAKEFIDFLFGKEEEEIEEGTLCRFWNHHKNASQIGYYGFSNSGKKHVLHNDNGWFINEFIYCEPITEIPKYRGKK